MTHEEMLEGMVKELQKMEQIIAKIKFHIEMIQLSQESMK